MFQWAELSVVLLLGIISSIGVQIVLAVAGRQKSQATVSNMDSDSALNWTAALSKMRAELEAVQDARNEDRLAMKAEYQTEIDALRQEAEERAAGYQAEIDSMKEAHARQIEKLRDEQAALTAQYRSETEKLVKRINEVEKENRQLLRENVEFRRQLEEFKNGN